MPILVDVATSSPPYKVSQTQAAEELKKRMGGRPAIARMIEAAASRSGIDTRSISVPDAEAEIGERFYPETADTPAPGTKRRMHLYREWSARLSVQAVTELLQVTDTQPEMIKRLITVSCTGFSAPNFDYDLIMSLNLPPNIQRTHIGFMGCAAAMVGFTTALEALDSGHDDHAMALLVAVELCSLHLQTEPTRDNILANLIFADGCAAALFSFDATAQARAKLVQTHSLLFQDSRYLMAWEIGNHGFEMALSPDLPDAISSQAVPAAKSIIRRMGLQPEDIRFWALHPGGRAIIDALQDGLRLTDDQVSPSRAVLQHYGNMSSASILYVLKEIFTRDRLKPDDWLCAIAFGPGLTMEMAFFRGV